MIQRNMPLGYHMINGKIEIDENKAEVVLKIFQEYADGASLLSIAKTLTVEGILNARNQARWCHGSVSRILDNVKYQGDDSYPELIEKNVFEQVQTRRKEQCEKLGRNLQYNSVSRQSAFSGVLYCGECGSTYRKYAERLGRGNQRVVWKCSKYIYQNRVCCRNCFLIDAQLESAFTSAANQVLGRKQYLDYIPKMKSPIPNIAYDKLDCKIKGLEAQGQYSSNELPALIFERAEAFYQTAQINDQPYNTEKMKQAFSCKNVITQFDEDLFRSIIRQVTVHKDGKLTFEFINGLSLDIPYETVERRMVEC